MVTNLKGRSYEEQLSDSKNPIMARVVPLRIISLIDANKYAHSPSPFLQQEDSIKIQYELTL